jgi:hypothetical protein
VHLSFFAWLKKTFTAAPARIGCKAIVKGIAGPATASTSRAGRRQEGELVRLLLETLMRVP